MADTEMQEQDVPSVAEDVLVDTEYIEEEPLQLEYQNPRETPQLLFPEDKTLTLDNDVNLTEDVLPKESGAYEDVDGQANAHEENGDVGVINHSEKKTDTDLQLLSPEAGDENVKKRKTWLLSDSEALVIDEAGTPDEQERFLREVETFYKENFLEFKAPMFYRRPLNILKLWRAVIKLGGYEVVTISKLWRQVGESFNPPKTCTTVSYAFRNFYEKALLEYEKYLTKNGELNLPGSTFILPSSNKKDASSHQGPGSGRAQRDSAARAMQGWHAQRHVGSGEVTEPMEKSLNSTPKHKKLKSIGMQKQKIQTSMDLVVSHETDKQSVADVIDVGPLADWVKINVKETKDSYEIFALVPGLLRNEDPIVRKMLEFRYRECYILFCLIVFLFAAPCYSQESLFDVKTLYDGKELWKETLPLKSGSRVYKLEGLKSSSWYEVKISYPASIPALFSLQLLRDGVMGLKVNQMRRRLLNTEKLIFRTESLEEVSNKDGLYVLVTVEPEGIVAIPNFKERTNVIYNIVCEEQLLGIPFSSWSVVVLVVLCLIVALILPRFLPSYLLIKDGDRDR